MWTRIGLQSFGGPAGQIAVMHRVLVEEKRWIGEDRFLHALNYCMLLPGPEAQQLATYIGWLLHGTRGGLVAGLLFILPGFVAILGLSFVYALWQHVPLATGIFLGLKAAVLALVVDSVRRIASRALRGRDHTVLAVLAFVALFAFEVPFPIVIATAAAIGLLRAKHAVSSPPAGRAGLLDAHLDAGTLNVAPPSLARSLRVLAIGLVLWAAPVVVVAALVGPDTVFVTLGLFFSKVAVVTFGGAYAVLAYVAQAAVDTWGWLTPGEMMDGLGLAETTPGPLIMVVQFVGFLAGHRNPGALDPMTSAVLAACITSWVTFAPCFLWIFLGAPYVEALRGNRALTAALSAITAAVVGVIANLAFWFAFHVLFSGVTEAHLGPVRLLVPNGVQLGPTLIAIAAAVALLRYHVSLGLVLSGSALLGLAWHLYAGP